HRGFDELHTVQSVSDSREQDLAVGPLASPGRTDRVRHLRIDRREALEIALGMAGGDASDARRRRPGTRASPREPASRLAEGRVPQLVGILLLPLEPASRAVDPQAQPVLVAGRHLACFWPVASSRSVSQSCAYSTWTTRISPSSPAATMARA